MLLHLQSIHTQTRLLTEMNNSSAGRLKADWKRIAWLIAAVLGSLVLGLVGVMLYMIYQERDQLYWSRLYLARSEISAMDTAAESFRKEHGNYPMELQELVHPNGGGGQFLSRISDAPWGGPFHYEVVHGADGDSIKIWAVPDRKTQDKIGITELSNRTNWQANLKP